MVIKLGKGKKEKKIRKTKFEVKKNYFEKYNEFPFPH